MPDCMIVYRHGTAVVASDVQLGLDVDVVANRTVDIEAEVPGVIRGVAEEDL